MTQEVIRTGDWVTDLRYKDTFQYNEHRDFMVKSRLRKATKEEIKKVRGY